MLVSINLYDIKGINFVGNAENRTRARWVPSENYAPPSHDSQNFTYTFWYHTVLCYHLLFNSPRKYWKDFSQRKLVTPHKLVINDIISRLLFLDKKHNLITLSDKVKWIYLKDNSYKIEALAFLDYDMPDKIRDFLAIYADRQQVFDSILLNKLEGFFSDLGWSLDLNPHLNSLSSFEI